MRLIALLLLLSAFAAAACSSNEIREVTLTPSELGTLKLVALTETEMAAFGVDENPGYLYPEKVSRLFPNAESGYLAVYGTSRNSSLIAITTAVFNSSDIASNLENLFSNPNLAIGDKHRLLYTESVLVLVAVGDETDSELVAEVADKLSRRLGMRVLDPRFANGTST